ncbi:4Fe-4S binding protein [Rhodovulum sp. DZ06]|uniref:4Fe-4S binding protein n=1 Tax=Rhodovulum sp. DZ06 TaxID=3425126 RepID=UPI003D35187E
MKWRTAFLSALLAATGAAAQAAELLTPEELAARIEPPYQLGEQVSDKGVWTLVNLDGADAGHVFQTAPLAPLPGFSGAPIDMLVEIDAEGRFIEVELIAHNEPIFVSGLGSAPLHEFLRQYRGLSISDQITVGVPYGAAGGGGDGIALDGVTKATASVRIAHESILAAAFKVVRDGPAGGGAAPPRPDPAMMPELSWDDLFARGLAHRRLVTNAEADAAFAGTLWEDDDPEAKADPGGAYLDLVVVDLGPPAAARAALSPDAFAELQEFLSIKPFNAPILVMDYGRHGLVAEDFVRNTAPALLSARQDGLPIALRDADLLGGLNDAVPEPGAFMILRADTRLGFDATRAWEITVRALREHGSFMPQVGHADFSAEIRSAPEFYIAPPPPPEPMPIWVEAALARGADLAVAAGMLVLLGAALALRQSRMAGLKRFTALRLGVLGFVIVFVGWWGQGQLSIVTPLAVMRTGVEGGSFAFLLYDPFSLVIWGGAIIGLVMWGRGFFCGWLCPYGAMQEYAHHAGRLAGVKQRKVSAAWDRRLKKVKYGVLAALAVATLVSPAATDAMVEVEPFKTAVTTWFIRDIPYVVYAGFWLVLGMTLFKGFCRYVCPLGALLALGDALRIRAWIPRREACGSPCRLCEARCRYQAIERSGKIQYDECFQCLDCVTIHDDRAQCVPLILAARKAQAARAKQEEMA